jgi:hypothetical protein
MRASPVRDKLIERNLLFISTPSLWPAWPFLPLVRRKDDTLEECGVLYDCWTKGRRPGYRATVFFTNIFELPTGEDELLALPRETFDTPDEVVAAGWRVD